MTALVQAADGSFYGTTNAWQWYSNPPVHPGTVFRLDSTGAFATVHTFSCLEGGDPAGTGWPVEVPLTQAVDGSIYGTTETGGANDRGTIFRLDASSGELKTLHIFDVVNGLLPGRLIQATDGAFYGSAGGEGYGLSNYSGGIVFRITPAGEFTIFHGFSATDGGWVPEDQLIQAADGMFYGTAYIQSPQCGLHPGGGGITALGLDGTGNLTYLCNFLDSGLTGSGPLIQVGDWFYGIGHSGNSGVLFGMDSTGVATPLHYFNPNVEGPPGAGPLVAADNHLFGTAGGSPNGTIFKTSIDTDNLEVIHAFNGIDGAWPNARLVATADQWLYGTTYGGGDHSLGTVFRMDYNGQSFTLIHSFSGVGGANVRTGLIQAPDGRLYGTAGGGPFGGHGVIFRLSSAQIAVNEVAPSSGPGGAGAAMAILGGGFVPGVTVTIGGRTATNVTVADSTFLNLLMPALSPGTYDVTVTAPGGGERDAPGRLRRQRRRAADHHGDFADVGSHGHGRDDQRERVHGRDSNRLQRGRGHELHRQLAHLDHRDGVAGRDHG